MALKAHLDSPIPATTQSGALQVEGRRQSRRALRLETSGRLQHGADNEVEANVTIHNISAAGLLLQTAMPLAVGEVLAIDLPQIGPVGAEIVWESEQLYGCAFQQALGEAALAAAQLGGDTGSVPAAPAPQSVSFGQAKGDALGVRINRLRRERDLTLAQVANVLGVSKPTVWAWEKGKARPLPERLEAIAEVLGSSVADLTDTSAQRDGAALIEDCRQRIAHEFGSDPKSVRIMIEM